jgi:hypothetical protein
LTGHAALAAAAPRATVTAQTSNYPGSVKIHHRIKNDHGKRTATLLPPKSALTTTSTGTATAALTTGILNRTKAVYAMITA